jgi:hypothetical protein
MEAKSLPGDEYDGRVWERFASFGDQLEQYSLACSQRHW